MSGIPCEENRIWRAYLRHAHHATSTTVIDVDLMTVSTAARELDCSEGAIRAAASRGALPCIRLANGLRLFRRSDLQQLRVARTSRAEQR